MKPLLIGTTVYGDHFDTFLRYGLPSLMADGNLPILKNKRDISLTIHTDKNSRFRLDNYFSQKNNNKNKEKIVSSNNYFSFPLHLIIDVTDEEKYLQLGRHQNADLRKAKEIGADYHCLMPDFIYSENCFAGVIAAIERGHKAIARLVVSTVQEDIAPELDRPRSAIDLATLSLLHIHPGIKHWLVSKEGCPNNHVLAWEGRDTLRMCSPHQTPVYIANEAIRLDDSNLPLDCILDKVIDGDIYCPKPEDGIVIIEVSPKDSRQPNDTPVDLEEFVRIMHTDTKGSARQLQLFNEETVDLIDRKSLGSTWWNDIDISEKKTIVRNALIPIMG